MQARINLILETLWNDIKKALNDEQGIDVAKLEELLKLYSRHIITELGIHNLPLPATVIENSLNYFLPDGVDPLIRFFLSYLETEPPDDSLYLDIYHRIHEATQNLTKLLESIAKRETSAMNLVWLQYKSYLAITQYWQGIILQDSREIKAGLEKNKTYLFIRQKIRHQFGLAARKLIWSLYLEELKKKEVDLKTLREQFSNPSPDFPHCFFSTPFDTWKQLLEFNQEEERFWKALWDQGKTPNPSWLQTIACYVGIQKPAKQAFTELIAQRLAENHEASTGCQTLVAISRAKATVITEEKMLAAQAEQLNQLEVYFSSKMTVLYAYINKQNKLLDDNEISFFLWIQTCLGFKKAIEESESITQLSELKTLAYTKITNSTLNILNAVTAAKSSRHSWNDLQFKAIKEYLDKLHLTIHCETTVLTSAINQHNEKFRNEWNFWPRKKTLKNLFESISKECPVGLRMS